MLHERQQLDRAKTAVQAYDVRSQSLQAVSYTHLDVYKRQIKAQVASIGAKKTQQFMGSIFSVCHYACLHFFCRFAAS